MRELEELEQDRQLEAEDDDFEDDDEEEEDDAEELLALIRRLTDKLDV